MRSAASFVVALASVSLCLAAPLGLVARQAGGACFVIGTKVLPAEVADAVKAIQNTVTCGTTTTIGKVPDVTSGAVTFSTIDFTKSKSNPLQFALDTFKTATPLASSNLKTFQDQLNVYIATEAGIRSEGGALQIKVVKFFLSMQVSRIMTAQGTPPTAPGLQVTHLRDKVTKNAGKVDKALLDEVTRLATVLA